MSSICFVTGFRRSGTTMLAELLNRHSCITIPPETRFFDEVYRRGIFGSERTIDRDQAIKRALTNRRVEDLELTQQMLASHLPDEQTDYVTLFRAILESYREKSGKQLVLEKSTVNLYYIRLLKKLLPDAKFVVIHRDGRDVVRSLMDAVWGGQNVFHHAAEWNHGIRCFSEQVEDFRQDIYEVRYERVVTDPQREIAGVCEFLDLAVEADQFEGKQSSGVVPDWEKSWKEKAKKGVDAINVSGWKGSAYADEICAAQKVMRFGLDYLGYDQEQIEALSLPPQSRLKCMLYSDQIYRPYKEVRENLRWLYRNSGLKEKISKGDRYLSDYK